METYSYIIFVGYMSYDNGWNFFDFNYRDYIFQ